MPIYNLAGRFSAVVLIVLSAFLVMTCLYHSSNHPNKEKNGFNRAISPIAVSSLNSSGRKDNIINIIGQSARYYYYQTRDPSVYAISKKNLDSLSFFTLPLSDTEKIRIGISFSSEIDYPNCYIYAGNTHCIIKFDLNKSAKSVYCPLGLFTRCARVSDSVFVIRGFYNAISKKDQFFMRAGIFHNQICLEDGLSKRTNDAGFSTDGFLHYDQSTGALVFISFFSNELLSFSPDLNLRYRKSTIDTMAAKPGKAEEVKKDHTKAITFVRPADIINYYNCVDRGIVYNFSDLQADNEAAEDFQNNSDIDVYSVDSGRYMGTFLLPKMDGGKCKHFQIYSDTLIALYDKKIMTYKIPIFKHGG